jgi:hypothetical protein
MCVVRMLLEEDVFAHVEGFIQPVTVWECLKL